MTPSRPQSPTTPRDDSEHPASCGGTYNGIGFIDAAQQHHLARCSNHGLRLVLSVERHGRYEYVNESVLRAALAVEPPR